MNTALLSPSAGPLASLAVRTGLELASWGLARADRRNDRDRLTARREARAVAERALAERDAMFRSGGYLPL